MKIDHNSICGQIFSMIFIKDPNYTINVFLCGAKSDSENSIRNALSKEMRKNPKFNVVFPEWIFGSLAKKDFNLLNLEYELAHFVDVIILPLEGEGAYAELGAFAQNDIIAKKIIVLNDIKHRHSRSFITLGPVAKVKELNESNVVYYNKTGDVITDLDSRKSFVINKILRIQEKKTSKNDLSNLFDLSRFLLFLIAIYQPVDKKEILEILRSFKKFNSDNHYLVSPSIDILINKEQIRPVSQNEKYSFCLSEIGHNLVFEDLLPKLSIVRQFSRIRASITSKRGRNKYNFIKEVGIRKYLANISIKH